ncbi:MAG: hypothetical protein ACQEW0_06870 [Pseudomonadota bacterium]
MKYVALAVLFITTPCFADFEVSISGLSGWDTKKDVISIKGEPTDKEDHALSMYSQSYFYPGLVLSFQDDFLTYITSDAVDKCTAQNICPGDNVDEAISAYGDPYIKSYDEQVIDQYNFNETKTDLCWYIASVEGEIINEISIACH